MSTQFRFPYHHVDGLLFFPAPPNPTEIEQYRYDADKWDYLCPHDGKSKAVKSFLKWKRSYYKLLFNELKKLGHPDNYQVFANHTMKRELRPYGRLGFMFYHWYNLSNEQTLVRMVGDEYVKLSLMYPA